MTALRQLRRVLLSTSGALLVGACVFGFRGLAPFVGEASLEQIDTVQIHLPPTELTLRGSANTTTLAWEGRFVALGATRDDALEQARELELVWETEQRVGRLRAELPLELRDLGELELIELDSSAYIAHEIRGAGEVQVSGIDAFLSIELEGGNVVVLGGLEQIVVDTGQGNVELRTGAAVDVHSGQGDVLVDLESPRDAVIDTRGAVEIGLSEVGNLEIDIAGAGVISVDLEGVAHLGSGDFFRTLGAGTRALRVRSGGGPVTVRMLDPGAGG